MRIIDSNKDFYDFCQYTYPDNTFTFDRRDSYILTRKEFSDNFYSKKYRYWNGHSEERNEAHFVLLQICHSFFLFELKITKEDNSGKCIDYNFSLLESWKNYSIKSELIKFSIIEFKWNLQKENITNKFVDAINIGDYEERKVFNKFRIYKGTCSSYEERHIPILKDIGIASLVNPYDIYYSFEEYFSE